MPISTENVKKVASLAKLKLSDADLEKYTVELGNILSFVEKLDELNLSGITATSHAVDISNVFRNDEAKLSTVLDSVFAQAPSQEDRLFKVPRIIG